MSRALWLGSRVMGHRPSRQDAQEFLYAVERSEALHRPWVAPPADSDAYLEYLRRGRKRNQFGFLVRRIDDGALVGVVNINDVVFGASLSGALGYYAFRDHEQKGYMTEAVGGVVAYAFGRLGLHRLEANIQPANAVSIRLVERCGFRREGYSTRYLRIDGEWRDHERWAITSP